MALISFDDASVAAVTKRNSTAGSLYKASRLFGFGAAASIILSIVILVLAILTSIEILPLLSMLLIILAGLSFVLYCLCMFVSALLLQQWIWAIGIFIFTPLAVLFEHMVMRKMTEK